MERERTQQLIDLKNELSPSTRKENKSERLYSESRKFRSKKRFDIRFQNLSFMTSATIKDSSYLR